MSRPGAPPPGTLRAACEAVVAAAVDAAHFLQQARARIGTLQVTHKQAGDVVSEVDREVQTLLRTALRYALPGAGFVGEEDAAGSDALSMLSWVVDPLDGTANYLRGYPHYAVSIGLVHDGEPQVGVVADVCRGEVFAAVRGQGATLDGRPLRCAAPRDSLEALAATVFPKPLSPRLPAYLEEFASVLRAFGGVRRSGAMTLELAHLAAGRIDAFWCHDMGPWDAAAGAVLLRESGACIEARDGRPLLGSRSLRAATPGLMPLLRELLPPLP